MSGVREAAAGVDGDYVVKCQGVRKRWGWIDINFVIIVMDSKLGKSSLTPNNGITISFTLVLFL